MPRLFHISVLLISILFILSNTKISYQQTFKTNEIKSEISKTDEDKYKKIVEENIEINQKKDDSVRNASVVLIILIITNIIIFYFISQKKKCPSCKKIFSSKVIECSPLMKDDRIIKKTGLKYSIKRKCIFCGYTWDTVENKKIKVFESEIDLI